MENAVSARKKNPFFFSRGPDNIRDPATVVMVSARAVARRSGGKAGEAVDLSPDCSDAAYERESFRVVFDSVGGLCHDVSYGVVRQQECPDFLFHQFRRFRSEYSVVADLVCFDLVQGQFEFPTAVIERRQFRRWRD